MKHNDTRNPNVPLQWWFQESNEGTVLFIVFYTLACRYGRCVGCNLYMQQSSGPVNCFCIMNQIDHVFKEPQVLERREEVRKVIISNNGSILDEKTFSSTALMYFIAVMGRTLPNAKLLSVETRPEYVDDAELIFLARARQDTFLENIEIAVGIEAYSRFIRNTLFGKGLDLTHIESLIAKAATYGFSIKCYFMFKPVAGITVEEAVWDIRHAAKYLDGLAKEHHACINMHLNVTYVAKGTELEEAFRKGDYEPPRLSDVVDAILPAEGSRITIFVGLYDEGLTVEGGSFIRPGDDKIISALQAFNKTQNYGILKG